MTVTSPYESRQEDPAMTNPRTDPDIRPYRDDTEQAHFEAMADWAQSPAATEALAAAAATTTPEQREQLQQQMRAMLAQSLPDDPAQDTPTEAFTRAELARTARGPGRPSLAGTTGAGSSRARQVRLSPELDQRLAAYTQRDGVRASDVLRQALTAYLDVHAPQHQRSA